MATSKARGVLILVLGAAAVVALVVVLQLRRRPDKGGAGAIPARAGASRTLAEPGDDRVPHPLFPTPERARTGTLFRVEEPPRPHVGQIRPPDPRDNTLRWSAHAHCEVDAARLVCSAAAGASAAVVSWRVGRGERTTVAEERHGASVHSTVVEERDRRGRPSRLALLNGYGQLVWARVFDATGRRYSASGQSGANQLEGCGYIELDGDRAVCLQWQLEPMRDARGVAIRQLRRDAAGFVVEERRLGVDGAPLAGHDGVQRITTERDAAGRPLVRRGYDADGRAALSTETGCHGQQTIRNGRGLVVESRCLGVDGQPTPDHKEVAIVRHDSDARGCRITDVRLDAEGRPVAAVDGVQLVKREVDARCTETRRTCHRDGRVPCGPGAPAEYRFHLDGDGRVVRVRHFDATGAPGGDPEYSAFEVRYRYDARGNRISEACFDTRGAAKECGNTGFHRVQASYDSAGRKTEDRFFDTDGRPTTNLGTARRRFIHDAYDHLYETRDLDEQGQPVESLGAASRRYLYDDGHRLFGLLVYDREGSLGEFSGCITGHTCPDTAWHAVRILRSPGGRVVQNVFFDRAGRLIRRNDCRLAQCWR